MKQGIAFGFCMVILSFFIVNQVSTNIFYKTNPEVVLIQNGEEIYSSPFLYSGEQYIWYIKEKDNEVKVLKDQEIIDYYDFDISVEELKNTDTIDFDKITKISGIDFEINMIINKDGYVQVLEANCPNKVDVQMGKIYDSSKIITCVPHNLIIKITGISGDEVADA